MCENQPKNQNDTLSCWNQFHARSSQIHYSGKYSAISINIVMIIIIVDIPPVFRPIISIYPIGHFLKFFFAIGTTELDIPILSHIFFERIL